ncbi:MAG: branched-chain-amino-acid transaminase [Candidatus Omnitrophica bacterium]|nr:branched-chain-amino-acid transaminase [Candidatus Omnitrophota bacterium]
MKIFLNGKLVSKEQATVSVFDHGYLYGDGVFEGIRSYNCLVFKLKEHVDRLYESAHSIMLDISMTKKEMIEAIVKTLKANNLKDAYLRVVVSRGVGDLGLDPRKCKGQQTVVIIADRINLYPKELYEQGMAIITVPTVRNLPEALNPQIKSLNYLNNILAKIEAMNSGCQEALMLDHLGYVAECTGDNIFVVKKGQLYTPPQCLGSLRGITRDAVIELAAKIKIASHEHVLTRHEVFISDECFLTGTAAEIIPVVKVDGRLIGNGKPGPISKKIMAKFKQITKVQGVKYTIK